MKSIRIDKIIIIAPITRLQETALYFRARQWARDKNRASKARYRADIGLLEPVERVATCIRVTEREQGKEKGEKPKRKTEHW